jgi:hypothetical protein
MAEVKSRESEAGRFARKYREEAIRDDRTNKPWTTAQKCADHAVVV